MKYFLFLFLITSSFYSQTGKIVYSSVYNFGGNQPSKIETNLFFADDSSLYQSQLKNDKITKKDEKTDSNADDSKLVEININVGSDSIGDLYYQNFQNPNIVCREAIFKNPGVKYYIYEDESNIKWQLLDEYKNISGYKCQKAATKFRGRNYEAWFTSEIPLSFGPWKFNGLPGLILEIYDHSGEVYFSAEHIQIPYLEAQKIVQKPIGDPLIGHRAFVEESNKISDRISQAILSRSPSGTRLESVKVTKNGLELEYEWEKE